MLPAAIYDLMESHHLYGIKAVFVAVNASPYIAACKCYARTMMAMGLRRVVRSLESVKSSKLAGICRYKPSSIRARPIPKGACASLPESVTLEDRLLLRQSFTSII